MSSYASNPVIEALLRRATQGVGKINRRTSAISGALQPFQASAAQTYGNAQSAEQGIGKALSGSLVQSGQAQASAIGSKLAGIQAPTQSVAQYGTAQATAGAGAGQALGALSSAELERLRDFGDAEKVYAAALPRLAELAGAQERRSFLQTAEEDLVTAMMEQSQRQQDLAIQQEETAYNRKQDALDRKRQAKQDKIEQFRYRREQRKAAATAAYQRKQDILHNRQAQDALNYETGQDYVHNTQAQQRADTSSMSAAETARHHRVQEQQAAKKAAAAAGGKDTSSKEFYAVREDAFARARAYKNPGTRRASSQISRSAAKARLWAEFGTQLVGRGYGRKAVNTMLERALDAAGY